MLGTGTSWGAADELIVRGAVIGGASKIFKRLNLVICTGDQSGASNTPYGQNK
jgi:hypothetical protein